MIKQNEQLLNDLLTELQQDITNKIMAKGGTVQGGSLFELSNSIESIPTGGGGSGGGMGVSLKESLPILRLAPPVSPTFTHKLCIPIGGGLTFGGTATVQTNLT